MKAAADRMRVSPLRGGPSAATRLRLKDLRSVTCERDLSSTGVQGAGGLRNVCLLDEPPNTHAASSCYDAASGFGSVNTASYVMTMFARIRSWLGLLTGSVVF